MDNLRRVIVHKSDTGYMFSIKDLGKAYTDAAPVSKVIPNGPADSAGLRPGDGLVAINSNLVKDKSYGDLLHIIKSNRGLSLELTVLENYFASASPNSQNQKILSVDERKRSTNSTPLSIEEDPTEEESFTESPIITKKKAYTYDKADFKKFTDLDEESSKSYNSTSDLCSENDYIKSATVNKYQSTQPRINYKPARATLSGSATPPDAIDSVITTTVSSVPETTDISVRSGKYDKSNRLVYHPAYKYGSPSSAPGNSFTHGPKRTHQLSDQTGSADRRGSSPSVSESHAKSQIKSSKFSNPLLNSTNLYRKASQTTQLSRSNCQMPSPKLQLNRVGGLVRAPLSVDETIDLDSEETDQNNIMVNSVDTGVSDQCSETGATNPSSRNSCDLDNIDNSAKNKYRYLHCSPVPYKSTNITSSSSLPLEDTPKSDGSRVQIQFTEDNNSKLSKRSSLLKSNSQNNNLNNSKDEIDHSGLYQCEPNLDSSIEENFTEKEEVILDFELKSHQGSKNLKKLKNILGDNYRGRSKTLDSDRKSKEDEIDFSPISVMVKWIICDGKTARSSWKQYTIEIDDSRLIFNRETNLTTASLEEKTLTIPLLNSVVEEEPEKRGRKNTIKVSHAGKQSECLIEFADKSLANKWLFALKEKTLPEKDDKVTKSSSFKERHSLTVPNLYVKESPNSQNQFKSKTKNKENAHSNANPTANIPMISTTNKSVIPQTMSRVKKLMNKFASSSHGSEFERQQAEWFNRPPVPGRLVGSSSCSEDMHGSIDSDCMVVPTGSCEFKQQLQPHEYGYPNAIPLHKWQRSIISALIPLSVELCISIIENFGMNHVGLYRVSGNKIALDYIYAELRKPVAEIDVTTDKWNDLHAISGVLKLFFRNLYDGLFPKDLYSDIIGACRMHENNRERRLLSIQRFLSIMEFAQDHPEYRYHRETLRYLMEHLSRVASRQVTNKMNARNLAVIFAPTLMKPPQETNEILVNDYKYKIQLIETLIKHHKWLFSQPLESGCKIPLDLEEEDVTNSAPPDDLLFPIDLNDKDPSTGVTDARPLVREILEKAKKIKDNDSFDIPSYTDNPSQTLAELSRQAYMFNSTEVGFKEVDIDEECEKRKCSNENAISQYKISTEQLLLDCSKDISDLKNVQNKSRENLNEIKEKIQKIDREIVKTEKIMETNSDKTPKKTVTRLYDIPGRNLSNISMVLASSKANPLEPSLVESGSQKTSLSTTEV